MDMGSGSLPPCGAGDSINGLSFGKKIYFEDVGGSSSKGAAAAPERKGKGVVKGGHPPPARCQVEGCHVDLSGGKAYYCKHKVCGMHSKAPVVTVGGMEKRFCQQCSRFHQLSEFDQGKRSCRRRLAGHNERRRKPPPCPPSRYGCHSSSYRDGQYRSVIMDFTYPRLPTSTREEWPTVRPSERVSTNLWHGRLDAPQGAGAVHETHSYVRSPNAAAELPPAQCIEGVSDTSCALSLLSAQSWGTTASRNRATPVSANSFDGAPMDQSNVSRYMNNPWSFKDHEAISSSLEVQCEMGLASDGGNCRYSGELELALQGNMQCPDLGLSQANDHTGLAIHWSP